MIKSWNPLHEPEPEEQPCKFCKTPVLTSSLHPMCPECQDHYATIAAEAKANTEAARAQTDLALAQMEVFLKGCTTQANAAAIVDRVLARAGGADGFADIWWEQLNHVITMEKGSAKALMALRKFAEFVVTVGKVSMGQLQDIENCDQEELDERMAPYLDRLKIVDETGTEKSA